jgi:hypothetical protein
MTVAKTVEDRAMEIYQDSRNDGCGHEESIVEALQEIVSMELGDEATAHAARTLASIEDGV